MTKRPPTLPVEEMAGDQAEANFLDHPAPVRLLPVEPPNFDSSPTEDSTITAIAHRYLDLVGSKDEDQWPRASRLLGLRMDLTACHLNGMPLRLTDLLEASDFALAHDIQGIERHMNRTTGKLTGSGHAACVEEGVFVPRFADIIPETEET